MWSLLDPNAARPQRDEVVASFSTARSVYLSKNLKTVHPFLFGPGESAPVYKDAEDVPQDTFACPQGRVVWEVAAAIRDFGTNETMTVGGASGLGVEVIGLPSGW